MLSSFQYHGRNLGQACFSTLIAGTALCLALTAPFCRAQDRPESTDPDAGSQPGFRPSTHFSRHPVVPPQASPQTAPAPAPAQPTNPVPAANPYPEVPVRPAKVSLKDGKVTVEAENSDLAQILQKLSDMSGMKVEGVNHSLRVFGVYGPASSREVLTSLLSGSGYNFVMVGGQPDGAPRELVLTAQKGSAVEAAPIQISPTPNPNPNPDGDDDGPDVDGPDPGATVLPPPEPNAVPMAAEQPSPEEEKRMQDNLDRLRQQSNTNSNSQPDLNPPE